MLSALARKLHLSTDNPRLTRSTGKDRTLCKSCNALDLEALVGGVRGRISWDQSTQALGTLAQLRRRAGECVLCRYVSEHAISKCYSDDDGQAQIYYVQGQAACFIKWKDDSLTRPKLRSPNDIVVGVASDMSKIRNEPVRGVATLRLMVEDAGSHSREIQGLAAPINNYGRGRMLWQHHEDMTLAKYWLGLCRTRHSGSACKRSVKHWPQHLYMVDVRRRCVVLAPQGCEYVALSYVWGTATSLKFTMTGGVNLFEPGALDTHWSSIARTVQEAIQITEVLGFEYLWMDALCIPQDERKIKQTLMAEMNCVYANAALTIVAAAGVDANVGLTGFRTDSRASEQDVLQLKGSNFITTVSSGSGLLQRQELTKWSTRAWTYEEQVFSRRQLIFTDTQLGWRCCSAKWREEMVLECFDEDVAQFSERPLVAEPQFEPLVLRDGISTKEVVSAYCEAVGQYSTRELTFPYDALNAFKGIEESFRAIVKMSFLWGIPEPAFTPSLAWIYSGSVRNDAIADWRLVKKGMATGQFHARFPSWSWCGWQKPAGVDGSKCRVSYAIAPRPEITWYRVGEDNKLLQVNEDITFNMVGGETRIWPEDAQPEQRDWVGTPQILTSEDENSVGPDGFVDLGLLRAWTRTSRMYMLYHPDTPSQSSLVRYEFTLQDDQRRPIDAKPAQNEGQGHFYIDVENPESLFQGQDEHGVQVTAVALGRNWSFDSTCLLTTQRDGVYYRVGICLIPEVIWMGLHTSWELITLG